MMNGCNNNLLPVCYCAVALLLIQGCYSCNFTIENSVRLNNEGVFLSTSDAGRVEICHCSDISSCHWQTVSTGSLTNPFSWKNSIVVCRELYFFDVQSPILQNTVLDANHADNSVPIYMTTFDCDGSESSLIDCSPGEGTGSQTHKSDAYVTCQTSPTNLKVRMIGSTDPTEGIIEIYTTTAGWSTVCTDFWRDIEANVFCKSLGYSGGVSNSYPRNSLVNTAVDFQPLISRMLCSASDTSVTGCSISYSTDCGDFVSLAGARCTSSNVADGDIRLYDIGATTFSRVEVFFAGRWGTVCDTAWNIEAGEVACRELGQTPSLTQIPTYVIAPFYRSMGHLSSQPIWIYGYTCDGDESELSDCSRPPFPIGFTGSSCGHATDAGLYCDYELSEGGVAGIITVIVLAVVTFIIIALTIPIIYEKHKKGEFQRWYQQYRHQWQAFKGTYCSCYTRGSRETNTQQSSSLELQTNDSSAVSTTITAHTSLSIIEQQQTPPNPPSQPTQSLPVSEPSAVFMPTVPPSYNVAISQHQVQPPPDYSNEKL